MRAFGRLHRLVQVTGASFLGLLCSNVGAAEDQQLEVTNSTSVATTNAAVDEKTQLPVRGVQTVEPGNTVTNDMFEVKPGFRLELVASEPLVESPVAMAFDQDGRLFVLERDDPDADNPGGTGRVRVLEDPDGEGVFSGSTILADGLVSPSAIVCYEGGVFVAAGPEILFLKDTQGRGTGDVHRVAFRGFEGTNATGSQRVIGALAWGPDNRIHGSSGGLGGTVVSPLSSAAPPVDLIQADFSFDPRTLVLRPESGPSRTGLAFHPDGTRFVCDPLRPLRRSMYEMHYYLRNPSFPPAAELMDVLDPAARVFAMMGREATNQLDSVPTRTNGVLAVPMQGARGLLIYASGLYTTNFFGNAFVADPSTRVIHRAVLRQQAFAWVAERAADERKSEFLRSSDPAFNPMHLACGPEGAIYIADARKDGRSGRIYRVVPQGFKSLKPPQLSKARIADLVGSLAHSNSWQRETASRLLFEREERQTGPTLLGNLVIKSRSPVVQVGALNALDGLGLINEKLILACLRVTDARVRQQAIRLSDRLVRQDGNFPDSVWNQLASMTRDVSPRVRYQLAFTLGNIPRRERAGVLSGILRQDLNDPWVRTAVLSSLAERGSDMLIGLAQDRQFLASPSGREFLHELGLTIGLAGRPTDVEAIVQHAAGTAPTPLEVFTMLGAVGEGLQRRGLSLAAADPQGLLGFRFSAAMAAATSIGTSEPARLEAIRTVASGPYDYTGAGYLLVLLLNNPRISTPVQLANLQAISRYSDPRMVPNLVERWPTMTAEIRRAAITALAANPSRVPALLDAIGSGGIPANELTSTQIQFLRSIPETTVAQRAVEVFGPFDPNRPEAIERFRPALGLVGVASRGRELFRARCASCHEFRGEGGSLGPSLSHLPAYGKPNVLTAILEPDLQIKPGFRSALIQMKSGLALAGVLERETANIIIINQPGAGRSAWARANIQFFQAQPWSMMPKEVDRGMTTQNMADLLQFFTGQ